MLLEGLHIPLTTPFHPDGRLNLPKLAQNVAHYSLTPAAGLLVLGPAGEPALLSDAETHAVLETAIHAAKPEKVLLAGVSHPSVANTLDRITHAHALGYDAAVVASPALPGLTAQEQCLYFQAVADRSALPVVLMGALDSDLVARLAFHPRIIAWIAESQPEAIPILLARIAIQRTVTVTSTFAAVTRRMAAAVQPLLTIDSLTTGGTTLAAAPPAVRTRTKVVGFQILTRQPTEMLAALRAGAVGACLPLAAAAPQACYEVYAAWKDADDPLADEKQLRLAPASIESIAALRHACDCNGYHGGPPRLPHLALTAEHRAAVDQAMSALKS